MKSRLLTLIGALVAPVLLHAASRPVIRTDGVLNAASYASNASPGGAIAQGSIFAIFGSGLGPATGVQVSSFPLGSQFAGVSITVTQGAKQVSAIPIFVLDSQINAILPSNTPVGTVSLQVAYKGQNSNSVPVQVAANAPGVFTAAGTGRGWGFFLNFVSATNQPIDTGTNSASPGQVVTMFATGSRPIAGSDGDTPPVGNFPFPVEIFVGGVPAASISYGGRAPALSGIDQYAFTIPAAAPTGCFVPVYLRANGAVSNSITMSIMPQGGACSDTHNPIAAALVKGGKIVSALLSQVAIGGGLIAGTNLTMSIDQAQVRAMQEPGGPFAYDPFLSVPPQGSCTSYAIRGDLLTQGFLQASAGKALNLGTLTASSADNSVALGSTRPGSGLYSTLLGGGLLPPFFAPLVTPTLHSTGGTDGSLSVPFPAGVALTGANLQALTAIDRTSPADVSWNAQAGVSAFVVGAVYDSPTDTSGVFLCISAPGASTLRVPNYVLANLPGGAAIAAGNGAVFFSAWPTLAQTTTPDPLLIFSSRQDTAAQAILSVR